MADSGSDGSTGTESDGTAETEPDGVEKNDDGRVAAKTVANSNGGSTSSE